jgi:hypothetical protein
LRSPCAAGTVRKAWQVAQQWSTYIYAAEGKTVAGGTGATDDSGAAFIQVKCKITWPITTFSINSSVFMGNTTK